MSKRREANMFGKILGAIWYLAVCGGAFAGGSALGFFERSNLISHVPLAELLHPKPPQESFAANQQTFLILGCDEDVYYQSEFVLKHAARSDMMMVVRMDFDKHEITGVSIPRDTWCQLPGFSEHKINAYHAIAKYGKANDLAKQAVEYLIGVNIDKVLVLDYDKMQKLVDLMGGVMVNVPRKMDYDDNAGKLHIHLKPGYQKLNGYDAMCYVRFRHSNDRRFTETDFQRQQREKDMLLGLKKAAVANWIHLPEIVDAGKAVIGESLTDSQILSLADFAKSVGPEHIHLGVIPTREDGNGLRLEKEKLPKVLAEYKLLGSSRVSYRTEQ